MNLYLFVVLWLRIIVINVFLFLRVFLKRYEVYVVSF